MKPYINIRKAAFLVAFLLFSVLCLQAEPRRQSSSKKIVAAENKVNSFATPDFAFPETVLANARPELDKSLTSGDYLTALRAAMQIVAARNEVDQKNFGRNISLLDSLASKLPAPYPSLVRLLQASMYSRLYDSQRWIFNQRKLPLNIFPDEPYSWSGELFALKVTGLLEEANGNAASSQKMPLKDISALLVDDVQAIKCGLSVYDFIALRSVDILRNFYYLNGDDEVLPFYSDNLNKEGSIGTRCRNYSKQLLQSLWSWREKERQKSALAFTAVQIAGDYDRDSRTAFLQEQAAKLIDCEQDAFLLEDLLTDCRPSEKGYPEFAPELLALTKVWLAKFPQSSYAPMVRRAKGEVEMPSVMMQTRNMVLPHREFEVEVTACNVKSAYLLVYKMKPAAVPMNSVNLKMFPSGATLVETIPVSFDGTVPFRDDTKVLMPALPEGQYVILPSSTQKLADKDKGKSLGGAVVLFNVSSIAVVKSNSPYEDFESRVFVVDAETQRPIEGASVKFYDDQGKVLNKSEITGGDGSCPMPKGFHRMKASFGHSVVWQYADVQYRKKINNETVHATALLDRALYRPGDNVQFSVVAWCQNGPEKELYKQGNLKLTLRDANHQPVDTITLTTDSWGRCNGAFQLPSSGMLGDWSIMVQPSVSENVNILCTKFFQVAEYKAPGFVVDLKKMNAVSTDSISFEGSVATYSGASLGGAAVKYKVQWNPMFRWGVDVPKPASYSSQTFAEDNGKFNITLPLENLIGKGYDMGIFILSAEVTSPSGETQAATPLRFSIGDACSLRPDVPDKIAVAGDTVKFKCPVYDMPGFPVVRTVVYAIKNESGTVVSSGNFESPALYLPAASLPSGKYQIEFSLSEREQAQCSTIIFRPDEKSVPVKTPLWLPSGKVVAPKGSSKVAVKVGSGYDGSWILCQISDQNGVKDSRWVESSGDVVNLDLPAPEGNSKLRLSFSGLHDFDQAVGAVEVVSEESLGRLKVSAETMRTRLTAGERERWRFKFSVTDCSDTVTAPFVPVMAVMTDKALNAIAPFKWSLDFLDRWYPVRGGLSRIDVYDQTASRRFKTLNSAKLFSAKVPNWNSWGVGFAGDNKMFYVRGITRSAAKEMIYEEMGSADGSVYNAAMIKAEAKMMSSKQTADDVAFTEGAEVEEVAVDADSGSGASEESSGDALRPVEMPLAFFMPSLQADEKGCLEVEFEVPDFNTTWQFQIAGYTGSLLGATLCADAVASKPVMVQSNLPRFVRTGDVVSLSAILFNNSTETVDIGGKIEVLTYDGEILVSKSFDKIQVYASRNRTVSISFKVPDTQSALVVRAYAYGAGSTDGEQALIPVLPSSQPVVEGIPFYMGSSASSAAGKLPKMKKDSRVMFKYNSNPLWQCVLALPEIAECESDNLLSVARALYSNQMALGIVEKDPEVRALIAKAMEKRDSLKSPLLTDGEFKISDIAFTPWTDDAASETQRLQNLDRLTDFAKGRETISSLVKKLQGLQNIDGGWSWCPEFKSSLFLTRNALSYFAALSRSGFLNEECMAMAAKAVDYCDGELVKEYSKKNRDVNASDLLRYFYVRDAFDLPLKVKGIADLKRKCTNALVNEWQTFDVADKARTAIMLHMSANYKKMAPIVLESLRQLAVKSETKGWSYEMLPTWGSAMSKVEVTALVLEAFAAVESNAEAVDGLRQWIVMQKETQGWNYQPAAVAAINALLSCGGNWMQMAHAPQLMIGGKSIDIPENNGLLDSYSLNLNAEEISGKKFTVEKSANSPAWGGFLISSIMPMAQVKQFDSENLSISKSYFVVEEPSGNLSEVRQLRKGDKVRVTLTVDCGKDMDYVAIVDERPGCLEPAGQLSGYSYVDGMSLYREVRNSRINYYIEHLQKGVHVISYDCDVGREGDYASGIVSAQSLYSPLQSAHSSGTTLQIKE